MCVFVSASAIAGGTEKRWASHLVQVVPPRSREDCNVCIRLQHGFENCALGQRQPVGRDQQHGGIALAIAMLLKLSRQMLGHEERISASKGSRKGSLGEMQLGLRLGVAT